MKAKDLKLEDQFGASEARVLDPYGFAVPVKKEHQGKVFPIHNEKGHLTLYRINPRCAKQTKLVRDQFGKGYLQIFRSILLAVPSVKVKWNEV